MLNPFRSAWVSFALVGLLASAWWGLAPVSFGGRDTYLILSGTSMLPRFRTGDLVVVRRNSGYTVGEVAAYQTPQLKTPILHQIVGHANGRYTFKGENNPFSDPSHPVKSEIIGRLWLNLGPTGKLIQWIRKPEVGAGLVGAAALYALWPHKRSRRGRMRRWRYGHV